MSHKPLSHLALSDNGFLFDSSSGDTFTMNSTGTCIMQGMIEGLSKEEILAGLTTEFDVTDEVASQDFDQLVHFCIDSGLIEDDGRY